MPIEMFETRTSWPRKCADSDSVRKPCAIGVPNGPLFARSTSTWIHWLSRVASANSLIWSWVMVTQSVAPEVGGAPARRGGVEEGLRALEISRHGAQVYQTGDRGMHVRGRSRHLRWIGWPPAHANPRRRTKSRASARTTPPSTSRCSRASTRCASGPGMYIGSTGPTGPAPPRVGGRRQRGRRGDGRRTAPASTSRCSPTAACRVADNGRGIPVDEHPQYKGKSAAEIVMTTLHAGGKFGGGGYKVSGGLHGVGVSVVNALSSRLVLEVDRDGKTYRQEYAAEKAGAGAVKPGVPQGKLKAVAAVEARAHRHERSRSGPTPTCSRRSSSATRPIAERLQVMAFLNRGLTIALHRRTARAQAVARRSRSTAASSTSSGTSTSRRSRCSRTSATSPTPAPRARSRSRGSGTPATTKACTRFANGISTTEGGMHAEGFKRALTQAINRYAKDRNLREGARTPTFQGDDVREGLTAIVSVRLADPQFEGQTKAKLGNTEIRSLVERATNEHFGALARGAPEPGEGDRRQGVERGAGPLRGEAGARPHPAQDRARRCGHARQARRLRVARPRRRRAVPRRGRLRRRFGTRRARPEERRRSCRCGARS